MVIMAKDKKATLYDKLSDSTKEKLKQAQGLYMKDVPYELRNRFKSMAREGFGNNYAVTLQYLMKVHDDTQVFMKLMDNQFILAKRIDDVEKHVMSSPDGEDKGTVKLLNGVEVKRK